MTQTKGNLSRWFERWDTANTGWHRDEPHDVLLDRFDPRCKRVLVPLCGASRDLGWLAEQGCEVVGVEVVRKAADQLFASLGKTPAVQRRGKFDVLTCANVTVVVGDFFAFDQTVAGTFDAVWDRAALVAIPPSRRSEYVEVLRSVARDADLLLVSCDYDQQLRDGPPYALSVDAITALFGELEQIIEESVDFDEALPWFMRRAHRGIVR